MRAEGEEAVELGVVGPVEVGRARGEQAERGAALGEQPRLLGVVGDVEGLHAVDSQRAEALDGVERLAGLGEVPEGMRPDGQAAGFVYGRHRLLHGGDLAQAIGRAALDEICADEVADVLDALPPQPGGVGGGVEHGGGYVRAPDRLSGGAARGDLGFVELQAKLAQGGGHAQRASLAIGQEVRQLRAQRGARVVDAVAEDVQLAIA